MALYTFLSKKANLKISLGKMVPDLVSFFQKRLNLHLVQTDLSSLVLRHSKKGQTWQIPLTYISFKKHNWNFWHRKEQCPTLTDNHLLSRVFKAHATQLPHTDTTTKMPPQRDDIFKNWKEFYICCPLFKFSKSIIYFEFKLLRREIYNSES